MQSRLIVTGVLVFALSLVLGCGPSGPTRGAVEGEIRLDGQPIDGGEISFVPTGPGAVSGYATIVGGKYEIPASRGPSTGKCKVEIRWSKPTGKKVKVPSGQFDETKQVIPARYNDRSTLEFETKPGTNQYTVELKSK